MAEASPQFLPRLDVLPAAQRRLWDELSELPEPFVLYGGTAVALHLGHRFSVDFDFFVRESIDPRLLTQKFAFLQDANIVQVERETLTVVADRDGPVKISFFGLPDFPRLAPPLRAQDNGLHIASLLDLAGTKASVVQVRAEAKDYIDIDAILQSGIELPQMLAAGRALYREGFAALSTLKALCYFEDGDVVSLPPEIRSRLTAAVRAVDLERLPLLAPMPREGAG